MRKGSRYGLIDDPEAWFDTAVWETSPPITYDEATAEKVAGSAKSFLKNAKSLLGAMEKGWPKCFFDPWYLVLIEKCSRSSSRKQVFGASLHGFMDVDWNASRISIWWSGMRRICMHKSENCGMLLKHQIFPSRWICLNGIRFRIGWSKTYWKNTWCSMNLLRLPFEMAGLSTYI